jgi:hypothetical protein
VSRTPRTDAAERGIFAIPADGLYVDADFARQLEARCNDLLDACKAAEWHSLDLPPAVVEQLAAAIAKAEGA